MSLESIISQLAQQTSSNAQGLESSLGDVDINDPAAMLQMHFALQKYSSLVNYQSGLIKTVRDLVSGIINKIN
ncbi:type III secretion system needle filament subunit SctF [Apirhabdus apintestini]|nr:type III secretion system needle filament subunit SctF [Enterobacteriaceae bacterium CA-0114]